MFPRVLLLYNQLTISPSDPDYAQEDGVLDDAVAIAQALVKRRLTTEHCTAVSMPCLLEKLFSLSNAGVVVVNLFEGFGGRSDGEEIIAQYLQQVDVAFTGSLWECLLQTRDKPQTKRML